MLSPRSLNSFATFVSPSPPLSRPLISPLPLTCQPLPPSFNHLRACASPLSTPQTLIIGGGAAGFFCAITLARLTSTPVTILESSTRVLQKVRISGGGRCNVTSALHHYDPLSFSAQYARGFREMPAVLSRYGAREVMQFFEKEGVALKTEETGKVFPVSDSSETVISALVRAAKGSGVKVITRARVVNVKGNSGDFRVVLKDGDVLRADFVVIATGNARDAYDWAAGLGHKIVPPVPSLFTFRIEDVGLTRLAGISVEDVVLELVVNGKRKKRAAGLEQRGSLLVTHWGLSGPVVLSLSAFGARLLYEEKYRMNCVINWVPKLSLTETVAVLREARTALGARNVTTISPLRRLLPARLWRYIVERTGGSGPEERWASLSNGQIEKLARALHAYKFQIAGKGEFKEEFVTAGGISLKCVNIKTFESKRVPGLYFAGEILDIDGRTGGYNLEFAWSSGHIAGASIAEKVDELSKAAVK